LISVAIGGYLLTVAAYVARCLQPGSYGQRFARLLAVLVLMRLAAGTINVLLKAPVWMQVVHLLLAGLTWITLILLAATTLTAGAGDESPVACGG
jgi:heme A synthase